MHYYPLNNPINFSPYLLAGAGGVYQGMDSFNVQTPVGIGLDVKIARNAYFNIQSEYRWSSAENNSNFNHGIGFKYFFGRKEVDTVQVLPVLEVPKVDTDMDGIFDNEDSCPTVAGLAVFRGCPDTDGDGVEDGRDDCPVIAGLVEFNGCPDSDGDGIKDGEDKCPSVPGVAAFGGCPDTDGDGIEDAMDKCPTFAGISAFQGCPDTDMDGTEDSKDKCPKTYGPISNSGCPVIEAADREVLTFAMKAVQFQLGKATLVNESYGVLNQIVNIMNKYPDYKLSIDGHTDNTGTAEVNRKLSENRAKACYDYLQSKGIPASRMSYQGFGPTKPIADNSTYSGRTLNRRVEFNLTPGL
jgi:outer membrane protein OmpA-like peptidoglycan-associated protein